MIRKVYNAVRSDLGGIALGLGCIGLLLFVFTVPLTFFGAHFWGGFRSGDVVQLSPAQHDAAVEHAFWWSVWHRLLPQLVISIVLISYGIFEAYKERQRKEERQ